MTWETNLHECIYSTVSDNYQFIYPMQKTNFLHFDEKSWFFILNFSFKKYRHFLKNSYTSKVILVYNNVFVLCELLYPPSSLMWEITRALSAYCVLAFWDMGSVWSCFLKWKFLFKGNIQRDKTRSKSCNSLLNKAPNCLVGCIIQKRWSPLLPICAQFFHFYPTMKE